ncbi:MAG: hypothetical protein M3R46_05595 [Actinomycetota bacterium]|nr:hypothetical protein [Actinomycetota bacterium]
MRLRENRPLFQQARLVVQPPLLYALALALADWLFDGFTASISLVVLCGIVISAVEWLFVGLIRGDARVRPAQGYSLVALAMIGLGVPTVVLAVLAFVLPGLRFDGFLAYLGSTILMYTSQGIPALVARAKRILQRP